MTGYSGPCPACSRPDAVLPDGSIPPHDVHGLTSPCNAPPTVGCSHAICLDVDGCHLNHTTAAQALAALNRRALLAHITRESLNLGLYHITAAEIEAAEL